MPDDFLNLGLSDDILISILIAIGVILIGIIGLVIRKSMTTDNVENRMKARLKEEHYDEVIRLGEESVRKGRSGFFTNYYLAQAYERKQRWNDAVRYYREASVSHSKSRTEELYHHILLCIAAILEKQNNLKDALSYYLMILDKNPDHPDALYATARILHGQNKLSKAAEYLERLLKKQPGLLDARQLYGKTLYELGNSNMALKQFELLEKYDPDQPEVYYYKGRALENLKMYSSATEAYLTCLKFSDLKPEFQNVARTSLVNHFIKQKNFTLAKKYLEQFIGETSDPEVLKEFYYLYGRLLWDAGNKYRAVEQYHEVAELDPKYKDANEIYEKYKGILQLPVLAHYFTGDEERFELSCRQILSHKRHELRHRSRDFYLYAVNNFFVIFYRYLEPATYSMLTDIEMQLNRYRKDVGNIEFFGYRGLTDDAMTHALTKNCTITEGDEFLGVIRDKVR